MVSWSACCCPGCLGLLPCMCHVMSPPCVSARHGESEPHSTLCAQINNATWFGSHSKQTRHAYAFSAHKPLLFSLHAPKGKLTMRVKVNTSTIGRGQLLKAQPMTIRRDEAHQCLHFLLSDGRTAKVRCSCPHDLTTALPAWQILSRCRVLS